MTNKDKTISVVMAAYNAETTIGMTIDHLLVDQTYQDIEIIVVDDCSSDATASIVQGYAEKYENIKIISLERNMGPYKARIIGADAATGSYLHFIDADDYLSNDFYRSMLHKAVTTNADIVIGSIVLDHKNTGEIKNFPLINDLPFERLEGPTIFESFVSQSGFNFIYHMNSTKLYSMELWRKARPDYDKITDHLIMADDVAMNVPLWYYAEILERVPTATLFYVKDDNDSATSNYKMSFQKMTKNISDLSQVFDFFDNFITEKGLEQKFGSYLLNWKKAFVRIYENNISKSQLPSAEQNELKQLLYKIAPFNRFEVWLDTPLFTINTLWRDEIQNIKSKITKPETTSVIFDFNTLFLSRVLPSGKTDYTIRKTGLEVYQLAINLEKLIRFRNFPEDFNLAQITDEIKNHDDISVSDHETGSVEIAFPLPIDIFTSRHFDICTGDRYGQSTTDTLRTILETVANYYFDNPFAVSIGDSFFSGQPTLLGYYAVGGNTLDDAHNPSSSPPLELLELINGDSDQQNNPYDIFFMRAVKHGAEQFAHSVHNISTELDIHSVADNFAAVAATALHPQSYADKQILSPLTHYQEPSNDFHSPENSLNGKSRITKLLVYALIDRARLIAAIKQTTNKHTADLPFVHNTLKTTYRRARSIKRGVHRG